MAANLRSAKEQTESLHQTLMQARISFDLWEGMREARTSRETVDAMQRFAGFFTGVEYALFDSFVVLLYSLYETRRDTVSICTLLRTLSATLTSEKKADFDRQVQGLKPTWVKIGILRNEVVGHQTLNSHPAESFAKAAVSPEEIRDFIDKSQHILGHVSSTAFNTCLAFNVKSKPYLEALLKDLRANYSLKRTAAGRLR